MMPVACDNQEDESEQRNQLLEIVYSSQWFLRLLKTAQQVDIPDWFVAAGVVRGLVWDNLHGYQKLTPVKDVDVIYFDPENLSRARDEEVEGNLGKYMPGVKWDVKNQAAVHLWFMDVFGYTMTPFHSSEDGIRTWNSTSIGIRLQANKDIFIAAPYGLTDLLQMKFRRNTAHIPKELFLAQARNIKEKWPMVKIIED